MAKCNAYTLLLVACFFVVAVTCKERDLSDVNKLYDEFLNTSFRNIPGAPSQYPEEFKIHHMMSLLANIPKILPSPLHFEHHDPNQLANGDVLAINSESMGRIYAVVSSANEKKVICFVTRDQRPVSDTVALFSMADNVHLREVGLDKVLDRDHGIVEVARQQNGEEIVKRARSELGHSFSFFSFNSEHFVTFAVTGKAQSPQLRNTFSLLEKAAITTSLASLADPTGRKVLGNLAKCIAELGTSFSQVAKRFVEDKLGEKVYAIIALTFQNVVKEQRKQHPALDIALQLFTIIREVTVKDIAMKTVREVTSDAAKKIAQKEAGEITSLAFKDIIATITSEGITSEAAKNIVAGKMVFKDIFKMKTAEGFTSGVAKEIAQKTAGEIPSGSVSTTSKWITGAKATFAIGTCIEGASLAYTLYDSHEKMKQGKISKVQFRQHMVKSSGAAGGSVIGNTVGGIIGSAILPGWGTIAGSVVGGMVGNYLGSWGGEQFDKLTFDQN